MRRREWISMHRQKAASTARSGKALRWLACMVALLGTTLARAQAVQQVADLYSGVGFEHSSVDQIGNLPNGVVGGLTYFKVRDRENGGELWVTDGSAANTHLFADICPGKCGSEPSDFFADGSTLYFSASDGRHGKELWQLTAGSSAPVMVADINPGADDSRPTGFRRATIRVGSSTQSRLFFSANDGSHGRELWSIVGSPRLEADINPGAASSNPVLIGPTDSGLKLLVLATTASIGAEAQLLSYSSFTALPTIAPLADLVANGSVYAGATLGANTWLLVQNLAQPTSTDTEIWVTQGTAASTIKLLALDNSSGLTPNVTLNRMFFAGKASASGNELYVSDGTVAGTQVVKDIRSGTADGVVGRATALGSAVLFIGNDGSSGAELWRSDGTTAGTQLLKDVVAGSSGITGNTGVVTTADNLAAYFGNGTVLMRSDGTAAGTSVVRSLGGTAAIAQLTPTSGAKMLFSRAIALDEPHFTDGTNAGTVSLGNLNDGIGDSNPQSLTPIGERLSFIASDDTLDNAMHSTTGSGAVLYLADQLENLGYLGGRLLAGTVFNGPATLLTTDGTTAGTSSLGTLELRSIHDGPPFRCSTELNGSLYFIAKDQSASSGENELYRSDGTVAGTVEVTDLTGGGKDGYVLDCYYDNANLLALGTRVLFVGAVNYGTTGRELMRSDGVNPAQLVADIDPGSGNSDPEQFTLLGTRMLFVATSNTTGKELWISDGTAQGTKLLKDIEPGPGSSEPLGLVRAGDLVFFHAGTTANGRELWVSDGTDVGTHLVADLYPGTGSAFRNDRQPRTLLKAQGRRVWFTATDNAATPCALYVSDGSAAGTRCGLNAADNLIYTNEVLTLSNGAVAFDAWRATDGEEVRVVRNGQLLNLPGGDVHAGPGSSGPSELVATPRGMVYFSADDGNTGRELWKLDLSDFIFTDGLE